MSLHNLLVRQIQRIGADDQTPPTIENWKKFLNYVSNAYTEAEQDHYLIERSIEVSSNEFLALTERLEAAQEIAHLGHWSYDTQKDIVILSNNLYKLFDIENCDHIANKDHFFKLAHPDDKKKLNELLGTALEERKRVESEIRIKNSKGDYRWFNIVAAVSSNNDESSKKLIGIAMDIDARKKIEDELERSNQELIKTARMAGMADVAISVLHNVGNTFNSAKVAIGLIQERISKHNLQKLNSIVGLLQENENHLESYLTNDAKGKLIPRYLIALNDVIKDDYGFIEQELCNITRSLKHINEIIVAQQSLSKVNEVIQEIHLESVIEDALKIGGDTLTKRQIRVVKNFQNAGYVKSNPSKITQILVNLIQNAQDAFDDVPDVKDKYITISVENKKTFTDVIVADNGSGVSPENLGNIFTFGFTTKKKGHGFGLHSSILAAQELKGNLRAESSGKGLGASFILSLPNIENTIQYEGY